jgi:iron complex transport system ATP-binding protein
MNARDGQAPAPAPGAESAPRTALEPAPDFLDLRHVTVARGERVVLEDICLAAGRREHMVLLGPNGCGKSTLIKTLTCEIYPMVLPGMRVSIFGQSRWDVSRLRRHLGVVSSELPGERTAATSGLDAVTAGFFSASTLWPNLEITAGMRERARAALARMDALHLAAQPVGEMSAGEKRRVMIARALVHEPQVLLLDEPSNGLDMAAQKGLRDTLNRLLAGGMGLLLVTHHLADILPSIDRVLLMSAGRLVADGGRGELLTAERLSGLFGTEVRLGERDGYLYSW